MIFRFIRRYSFLERNPRVHIAGDQPRQILVERYTDQVKVLPSDRTLAGQGGQLLFAQTEQLSIDQFIVTADTDCSTPDLARSC